MPIDTLEPLGTVQKIPEIPIDSRITDRANEPHYTCPTGKKAIFTGYVQCTSRGAAASASLRDPTDTFNVATWDSSSNFQDSVWSSLQVGTRINITLQLEAGQEIKTTQSTGTNAEFNVVGKIKELDV